MTKRLLWIDCTGGAVAGALVLALSGWFSALYQLPAATVLFIGAANVAYASFSFSLAVRRRRPLALIKLLAVGNMGWSVLCVMLLFMYAGSATWLGSTHLALEALFVGGLGVLEWRNRLALCRNE